MSRHSDHKCSKRDRADTSKRKPRTCLGPGCDRTFMSDGPGDRICPRCRGSEVWQNPPTIYGTPHGQAARAGD